MIPETFRGCPTKELAKRLKNGNMDEFFNLGGKCPI